MTGPSASLYNTILRKFYTAPLVAELDAQLSTFQIQGPAVPASWYIERGLKVPWIYVPPPRHVRVWRDIKWRIRDIREAIGFWIAGTDPREDW